VSAGKNALLPATFEQYKWVLPSLRIDCSDCDKEYQRTAAAEACFADQKDAKPQARPGG
jgi:hypothetical protein